MLIQLILFGTAGIAGGDGTFRAPLTIPNAGHPGPAMVQAGDLDGDGRIDLLTASGSPSVLAFLQGASRLEWRPVPLRVGALVWFARAADFDGDGLDDVVAADVSATAYFIRSAGGGEFATPQPLPESVGARWTAIGDWNGDGDLDLATANVSRANLTAFLGDGQGDFALSQDLPGSREHTLEALDFDGDGRMDLMLGSGLDGLRPHRGRGDGTFVPGISILDFGCVEYLAEVGRWEGGRYVLAGDLDGDGRGDIAPTCIETASASAGLSRGDGTFRKTLQVAGGPDVDSTAIADLDGDGRADLALASKGSRALLVYRGSGGGELLADPVAFEPTGEDPVFLIARDLDGDGLPDAVTADQGSSSLTVFWGSRGEGFLESASRLSGVFPSRAMAAADGNGDGFPDLFVSRGERPEVQVYLGPARAGPWSPALAIATREKYGLLQAADLDGDGVPDLAGADPAAGTFLWALLDREGKVRGEGSLPAGLSPAEVVVGAIDESSPADVAVPCQGSSHVALFLNRGGGAFAPARLLPTVARPGGAVLGRLDGDRYSDLVVISDTLVAVHWGKGRGELADPVEVLDDPARLFTAAAMGDIDGDGASDLAVADARSGAVLLLRGDGARGLGPPRPVQTGGAPGSLALADLDGDGLLDLVAASPGSQAASTLLQREGGFPRLHLNGLGMSPSSLLVLDLDRDGALDLAAFSPASAVVLFGRHGPSGARFRRGDADASGKADLTDALAVLGYLFQGMSAPACLAAGDADGSGRIDLVDAAALLAFLFQGGPAPPPPGPIACGPAPDRTELPCERGCGE